MIGSKMLIPGVKCTLMVPELVHSFGLGRSAAMLLQQIHYWISNQEISGKTEHGKKWIYNSYDDWAKDISVFSAGTVKRCFKKLKALNLIQVEQFSKTKGDRTSWVTINYDMLAKKIDESPEQKNREKKNKKSTDHQSKMLPSSEQNAPIINDKITNKDINTKSEEKSVIKSVRVSLESLNQVEQVKNTNYTNDLKNTKDSSNSDQSSSKTTITQDMLSFWNKTFPKSQTSMSKELAPLLVSAFKIKFNSDMIQWKHYCLTIESSKYLTGESFNLSIYWSLKFNTIDRIRAGEFGVKETPLPYSVTDLIETEKDEIRLLDEPEKCKETRYLLLVKYGPQTYKSWFKSLEFKLDGETVRFKTNSNFQRDWILKNYPELVL